MGVQGPIGSGLGSSAAGWGEDDATASPDDAAAAVDAAADRAAHVVRAASAGGAAGPWSIGLDPAVAAQLDALGALDGPTNPAPLSFDRLHEASDLLVAAGLAWERDAIAAAALPVRFRAGIREGASPRDQVVSDLDACNRAGRLTDGTLPLAAYLDVAAAGAADPEIGRGLALLADLARGVDVDPALLDAAAERAHALVLAGAGPATDASVAAAPARLGQERSFEVAHLILAAGLEGRRADLLGTLPPAFAASLPLAGNPSAQVMLDLAECERTGRLVDGTSPLLAVLDQAAALATDPALGQALALYADLARGADVDPAALAAAAARGREAVLSGTPEPPGAPAPRALGFDEVSAASSLIGLAGLADRRTDLLAGLPPGFAASLATLAAPASQVTVDLVACGRAGRLTDGTAPLARLLDNAAGLASDPRVREHLGALARHARGGDVDRAAIERAQAFAAAATAAKPRDPPDAPLALDERDLAHLFAAARGAGLDRASLLAGMHPGFVASLPVYTPGPVQLLADLRVLADARLATGEVPARTWLRNAAAATPDPDLRAVFERILAR